MLQFILFALLPLALTALFPTAHATRHSELTARNLNSLFDARAYLTAHNTIRKRHNAPDLAWSQQYAAQAQKWAKKCDFERTEGTLSTVPYGELHIAATDKFDISTAIGSLAKDQAAYNPAKPTYNHWTQIVWRSTTHVGCARATCNNLLGPKTGPATYHVCFYDPAGNVVGKASENVHV